MQQPRISPILLWWFIRGHALLCTHGVVKTVVSASPPEAEPQPTYTKMRSIYMHLFAVLVTLHVSDEVSIQNQIA
jgi:hypothetical protein